MNKPIDFNRLSADEFNSLSDAVAAHATLAVDNNGEVAAHCNFCEGSADAAWMEAEYAADAEDIINSIQHLSDCPVYQARIREDDAQQLVDSIMQEPVLI